ncbi:AIR synthase related protein [Candidatus Neomarinimicrobiota bacterium]
MNTSQLDILYQQVKNREFGENTESIRDLTKIRLTNEFSLIIAVDSDGGIGSLEGDIIKCDPYQLGRFAMRVPLLELLSSGANPIAAFDMLTIPMKGPGEEIVRGVRDELSQAGLPSDFPLSGSTEDNVPTNMTGIGTTIIGLVQNIDFRPGSSKRGDVIICVGIPKSAPVDIVLLDDIEIVNQQDILDLLRIEGVHEILPIGSKGIENEAHQLAEFSSVKFIPKVDLGININKSGGPSTCIIVSCKPEVLKQIMNFSCVPINKVGELV